MWENDATAQTDSANRTKSYARKSNALQRSRGWQPIQGVPGDAVPWPEREVSSLPSLFPRLRRQAAQESHLSSYERRPASAFYSSKKQITRYCSTFEYNIRYYLEQCSMLLSVVFIADFSANS